MGSFRLLGKDIIAYGVMGAASRSVHILLLPFLTSQFSTEQYGTIEIVAIWTNVFTLFIVLSLQNAIARFWAEAETDSKFVDLVLGVFSFLFVYGLFINVVVASQADWLAKMVVGDPTAGTYIVLGTLSAYFAALAHIPLMILRMQRRVAYYIFINLIQTVMFAGLAIILVRNFDFGVDGVFIGQVLAGALALVVGLIGTSGFFLGKFTLKRLITSLKFSIPMVPAVLVSKINGSLDRFILLVFFGIGVVGVYSASARIAMIMSLLVAVFQQAWTPLAMKVIEQAERRNKFYQRGLNYYLGCMVSLALLFCAFIKEFVTVLVPAEYQEGYVVIPWIVAAAIIHGTAAFTNLGMIVKKKTFGNTKAAWTGAAANLLISGSAIPFFGIWGAAFGAVVGSLIFTMLLYRYSWQVAGIQYEIGSIFGVALTYLLSAIVFLFISNHVPDELTSIGMRSLLLLFSVFVVFHMTADEHVYRAVRSVYLSRKVPSKGS